MSNPDQDSVTGLALALRRQLELLRAVGVHHVMVDTRPGRLMEQLTPSPHPAQRPESAMQRPTVKQPAAPPKPVPVNVASVAAEQLRQVGGELALSLANRADAVAACAQCGLCATRTQTVYSRGNPLSPLMIIGEAPGSDEDRLGLPFVGRAGKLLDEILSKGMGYHPDSVYICNVLKCGPPNNRNPEPAEIEACRPYLEEQIQMVNPEVILAMGRLPAQWLMGSTEGIGELRGQMVEAFGRKVVATYHPAYLLRNSSANKLAWEDVQLVMDHFGRGQPLVMRPQS